MSPAGDVTVDANNHYLYDAEGRLCAATTLEGAIGYLYDAAGKVKENSGVRNGVSSSTLLVNAAD